MAGKHRYYCEKPGKLNQYNNKREPTESEIKILREASPFLSQKLCSDLIGCSENTIMRWKKEHPEVAEAMTKPLPKHVVKAGKELFARGMSDPKHSDLLTMFLTRRGGWNETNIVENKKDLKLEVVFEGQIDEEKKAGDVNLELGFEDED